MVCRKLQKEKAINIIADELDENIDLISKICQAAAESDPDDYEHILELLDLDLEIDEDFESDEDDEN